MSPLFLFLAALTLLGAVGAVGFRNPVHCALSLVGTFAGLAGFYLGLGAQFLGLAQVLVYIGAVAILLVFVLLVTRSGADGTTSAAACGWRTAGFGALGLAGILGTAIAEANGLPRRPPAPELPGVRELGQALVTDFVVPLQVIGLLLTVALIGAAVLALREGRKPAGSAGKGRSR